VLKHDQTVPSMSTGKEISIRDIAEAAGVSHTTVSRALHGRGRMRADTRAHIQALAEQMGYTPDVRARSLVSGETRTIGVVVTTIADPFVVQIVDGIEAVAQAAGYSLFLSASHSDPERELAVVETFHQRRVDAVIVTASRVGNLYAARLKQFGAPIVLINNLQEGPYLYSVSADDVAGAQLAVAHLLELGHRRIAYLGSTSRPISSLRRQQGYAAALQEAGISFDPALVAAPEAESDLAAGQEGLRMLLAAAPTALFAYNDMTAIGVLQGAARMGIDIPGKLSVIGFDDNEIARLVTPPLSTIHQPQQELGRRAMHMALDLLAKRQINDVILPCTLVLRATTASPTH